MGPGDWGVSVKFGSTGAQNPNPKNVNKMYGWYLGRNTNRTAFFFSGNSVFSAIVHYVLRYIQHCFNANSVLARMHNSSPIR